MCIKEPKYLLINGVPFPKCHVSAQKACHKSIPAMLLSICFTLNEEEGFVQGYKLGKIQRVLLSCTVDDTKPGLPTCLLVIKMIL